MSRLSPIPSGPSTRRSGAHPAAGFTLIELLVVIAIIAILAAILFPVFAQARAKARQMSCLSNEKQIGLGMMQYFQDYDESAPFFRIVGNNGGDWWSARMMNWKDLIYPYLKNGGRPYNNGQPYADEGSGGVFVCPENSATWSRANVWWTVPHPGDETTRFPRGYAVNGYAGVNENGKDQNNGGYFWPCVGDGSCSKNQGQLATIQTPSGTIMVAESRLPFPDINSGFAIDECTQDGQPWGGQPTSCVQGHRGGFTNFIFFDGHAKAVKMVQSIQNDLWDCYTSPKSFGASQQQSDLNAANKIQEWNPGF